MKQERPLLVLTYQVHPEHEAAFNEWYEAYMKRFMKRVPEMVTGRRVVTERNGVKQFLTIYEIESPEKVASAMANIMQDTPERIKDSEEWHEWEHTTLSMLNDAVYNVLQYEERECDCCCK